MKMHGAQFGKVRLKSEPLRAYVMKLNADGTPTEDDPEEVQARFIFVPEDIQDLCEAGATYYLQALQQGAPAPEAVLRQKQLLMISWGLRRDLPGLREQVYPFPLSAMDAEGNWVRDPKTRYVNLKAAPIRRQCPNAAQLWRQYEAFESAEFPPEVTEAQFLELYEEGKNVSLQTLACKDDFWKLQLVLPGLVAAYRRFEAGSGGAG